MTSKIENAWQNMARNLHEKTGKSLDEWIQIARSSGAAKHGEVVKYLKARHGLTHGYANMIALRAFESADEQRSREKDPVAAQYAGEKASLRPIYEALVGAVLRFGDDVEVASKKGYVSLRRDKQFAIIQPSSKARVDLGLNLGSVKPKGRLEASGSFNSMVSHRVRIGTADQVDAELIRWIRAAYDQA